MARCGCANLSEFGPDLAISRSFNIVGAAFLAPGHQFILGKAAVSSQ